MEILLVDSPQQAAVLVADEFERLLAEKPAAVLGLATGSTPLPAYRELVRRWEQGRIDFRSARFFLLDEYVGIPAGDPASYRSFITRELLDRVHVEDTQLTAPDGCADDLAGACTRYEEAIEAAGGIDLQVLGIGRDGHLGFNEPGSSLSSRTRVKTLASVTRSDNARFFEEGAQTPFHAVTVGLGTILDAKALLLIATGRAKAPAVAAAVEGPLSARCPASAVQLHPSAKVFVDQAAAAQLQLATYYREVQAKKGSLAR